ncbi:rhamnulokinase family protein [Leifsonia sp. NPDC058230]|uniref:rhamnulokinase n=1 Tax=Leifsonia sp. NPDC058230 TaxID=3346391 RepID=UPI0036DD8D49
MSGTHGAGDRAGDADAVGAVAAVDLGATSGRVMLGRVGPNTLELTEVARFDNTPVRLWDGTRAALHWDVVGLFSEAVQGLAAAVRSEPGLRSIGVDSWAVDYGLLSGGRLRGIPHHYRDERSERGVAAVHRITDPAALYQENGLQFLPFNSLYQFAADAEDGLLQDADTALLIPDLIAYWLTGRRVAERTNASTTGLLTLAGEWNDQLIDRLGLPRRILPPLVDPGEVIGTLLPAIASELQLPSGGTGAPVVTAVGSHDTASAVLAVPMRPETSVYISCGTWGLVGVELDHAVLGEAGRLANVTNERAVGGRIRYLHNVMGLWLLSESLRTWRARGEDADLASLLERAGRHGVPFTVFDAEDPRFLAPGDIPSRIADWCREHDLSTPADHVSMVRSIIESLAEALASTAHQVASLAGVPVETVHIVGGGARNALLCRAVADRSGLPVVAGPVEATAIGNVLVQAGAAGLTDASPEALRALVATAFPPTRYVPAAER